MSIDYLKMIEMSYYINTLNYLLEYIKSILYIYHV